MNPLKQNVSPFPAYHVWPVSFSLEIPPHPVDETATSVKFAFPATNGAYFRKILVSVKFVSAILGPEMAAQIFWTPAKKCVLSAGKPMSIKFRVLGGGGGSADVKNFYGRC